MRKIIHVDMDCFYAAVEMRDNPSLRNIPIAVGGSADRRGVIATCNYAARRFGVRSAMATAYALKLCPDLKLVKGRMALYQQESNKLRAIFADYTDLIEPLSLDEAFLDVTQSDLYQGSATRIAEEIRYRIANELNLTASAGVAPCKFVAKVASDENKPNGLCVITPDKLDEFVRQLPLKKIPGVGAVTVQKLQQLGLQTCDDVRRYPQTELQKRFGKFGQVLWDRAHGIDERPVQINRVRKSVGVERTLSDDIHSVEECEDVIEVLYAKLNERLIAHQQKHNGGRPPNIRTLGVKLKFSDFQLTTVEHRYPSVHRSAFIPLLKEAYLRANGRGVRLVGVHVGLADKEEHLQLDLPLVMNN
ncbi:MAG: DNA polymerase IV [Alteromonadaceae bacterium]|nr:DNA polymerase IV [Alteromonadaceae bacterium]